MRQSRPRLARRERALVITALLALGVWGALATADQEEAMWVWQDGERYTTQRGSTGMDRKGAAMQGTCLGMNWGAGADHYAEYRIEWPRAAEARLILRHAREPAGAARLQVRLDGQ